MWSYLVGLLAISVFLYEPITRMLTGRTRPDWRSEPPPSLLLNESLIAIEGPDDAALACPPDSYRVRIVAREPLMLYLEGFLSAEERSHLLEISEPLYEPSTVTHDGGESTHRDQSVRVSDVALVPRTPTVRCIEARARALQGWRRDHWLERLRTQRYRPGGRYDAHYDWSADARGGGWGRVSSFMVWVDAGAGLQGGGTAFPRLALPDRRARQWCPLVECQDADADADTDTDAGAAIVAGANTSAGLVFRPVPGNAVFWANFRPDSSGRGYEESWHAGLPIQHGVKVGLNIWTWGRVD